MKEAMSRSQAPTRTIARGSERAAGARAPKMDVLSHGMSRNKSKESTPRINHAAFQPKPERNFNFSRRIDTGPIQIHKMEKSLNKAVQFVPRQQFLETKPRTSQRGGEVFTRIHQEKVPVINKEVMRPQSAFRLPNKAEQSPFRLPYVSPDKPEVTLPFNPTEQKSQRMKEARTYRRRIRRRNRAARKEQQYRQEIQQRLLLERAPRRTEEKQAQERKPEQLHKQVRKNDNLTYKQIRSDVEQAARVHKALGKLKAQGNLPPATYKNIEGTILKVLERNSEIIKQQQEKAKTKTRTRTTEVSEEALRKLQAVRIVDEISLLPQQARQERINQIRTTLPQNQMNEVIKVVNQRNNLSLISLFYQDMQPQQGQGGTEKNQRPTRDKNRPQAQKEEEKIRSLRQKEQQQQQKEEEQNKNGHPIHLQVSESTRSFRVAEIFKAIDSTPEETVSGADIVSKLPHPQSAESQSPVLFASLRRQNRKEGSPALQEVKATEDGGLKEVYNRINSLPKVEKQEAYRQATEINKQISPIEATIYPTAPRPTKQDIDLVFANAA
jgi:hypothetical protein